MSSTIPSALRVEAVVQATDLPEISRYGVSLSLKREDLLFPSLSGNKYRKLKYNLKRAGELGHGTILTFGGAYSNHLHATAAAGRLYGFRTIGIVRGEELSGRPLNPTLESAQQRGMELHFISRAQYRNKEDPQFLNEIASRFGPCYILPEGGTNELAVRGCEEILGREDHQYTHICCPVGTGGTLAGLVRSSAGRQVVQGYPALRAPGLEGDLRKWIPEENWELVGGYHFGGYGRVTPGLIGFINSFRRDTGIPLDPVYTGKMVFGILGEISRGRIPEGSRILAIHTGGLQGIPGMNERLRKKNLPLLEL